MLDRVSPQAPRYGPAGGYVRSPYDSFDGHLSYGLPPPAESRADLQRLVACLLRYRLLIAFFMAVGLGLGFLAFALQTPTYQATARIEIMAPAARVVRDLEAVTETADLRSFQTAIEKLKSRGVILHAVQALALTDHADFLFPRQRFSLSNLFNRMAGRPEVIPGEGVDYEWREQVAVSRVQANLVVTLIRNTSVITLAYRDADPERARAIVNQIADSYVDQRQEQTSQASNLARQFIGDQVVEVKRKLAQSEAELVAYAKAEGITATGSEGSLIEQNIRAINASLSQAVGERLAAESLVQQIDEGNGAQLAAVLENQAGLVIRGRIVELRAQYQQNLRLFKPDYPDMRMLKGQIGEYEKQLAELNAAVIGSIRQRHAEAAAREGEIERKLAELQVRHSAYSDRLIHYTILKREVDSHRAQYDGLVAKLNEIGVGAELKAPGATVLDYAVATLKPIAPQLTRSLLVGLLLACAVAAFLIYVLEHLSTAFRTPEQVEGALQMPVLSALPHVAGDEIEAALADTKSTLSEAFRSLRTALQFAGTDGAPRMLLVTSAEPGEGKTTTACRIAQDFAAIGQRVLLVDADMRRPSIHRRLKLSNRRGLSDVLARRVTRKAFPSLFQVAGPRMMALTAGPIAPNPVDLLSSQRTGMLFDAFQRRYDLVVLDGPPVLGLSDAPILSRLADATVMVVSARQVDRKSALLAVNNLRSAGANVIGAAMTKVRASDFDAAYAYSYPPAAEPAPRSGRRLPRNAVAWDYYGEPHVSKPGLAGLCREAFDRLNALLVGSLKRARKFRF